jgi:hypothetical protein
MLLRASCFVAASTPLSPHLSPYLRFEGPNTNKGVGMGWRSRGGARVRTALQVPFRSCCVIAVALPAFRICALHPGVVVRTRELE